ncbi:MAG TPA: DUF2934 domain-containing protein [Hansschlegelia sp.]
MNDHERKIRDAAYRLWEQAGQPEGRDREFWLKAEKSLKDEPADGPKGKSPKKAAMPMEPVEKTPLQKPGKLAKVASDLAAADAGKAQSATKGRASAKAKSESVAAEPPASADDPAVESSKKASQAAGLTPGAVSRAKARGKATQAKGS